MPIMTIHDVPSTALRRRPSRLSRGLPALLLTLLLAGIAAPVAAAPTIRLVGDGATFPAPLYLRWFRDYYNANKTVQPDYQGTSSAGGIRDLIIGNTDFAGADLRMSEEDVAKVGGGVVQLPMTAGAIVFVYNLAGVDDLKLSREALIGIFSGDIEHWTDPRIAAANPGIELPDKPVTLVARVGASGTTYNLTRHLSAISPALAEQVGVTMSPVWPDAISSRGALVKGSGNDGVAALVDALPGSIGYVQYAYGHLTRMKMAALENKVGEIVAPTVQGFTAAVDAVRTEATEAALSDPDAPGAYPLIAVSWLLLPKQYEDAEKRAALIDVLRYALGPGQKDVERLGYIPYSEAVLESLRAHLDELDPR
jgi:phosphate transport system substrate-binding protein